MATPALSKPWLAETHAPKAQARPLRVAALTLLWLALANLVAAWWLEHDESNRGYAVVRAKWRLLKELDGPVDYLVLGDSTCDQGIDPDRLGEGLGGKALNLCTVGDMTLIHDAWLLHSYLERHRAPKAVIIGHSYDVWARDESHLGLALWNLDLLGVKWAALPPLFELGAKGALRNRLTPYLPLYFQPETLRKVLSGTVPPRRELSATGFLRVPNADPGRVEDDTNRHLDLLSTSLVQFSPANQRGVAALLADGRRYGVPLVFVNAPVHERLRRSPLFQQRMLDLALLLEELLQGNPLAALGLREPIGFPASQMQNADHLTSDGALRYTSQVAEVVRDSLARWHHD